MQNNLNFFIKNMFYFFNKFSADNNWIDPKSPYYNKYKEISDDLDILADPSRPYWNSDLAKKLMFLTQAFESGLWRHKKELGNGPSTGYSQVKRSTYYDILAGLFSKGGKNKKLYDDINAAFYPALDDDKRAIYQKNYNNYYKNNKNSLHRFFKYFKPDEMKFVPYEQLINDSSFDTNIGRLVYKNVPEPIPVDDTKDYRKLFKYYLDNYNKVTKDSFKKMQALNPSAYARFKTYEDFYKARKKRWDDTLNRLGLIR